MCINICVLMRRPVVVHLPSLGLKQNPKGWIVSSTPPSPFKNTFSLLKCEKIKDLAEASAQYVEKIMENCHAKVTTLNVRHLGNHFRLDDRDLKWKIASESIRQTPPSLLV